MKADKPRRIQLSRAKGWRLPDNAVSVARPGPFGNPYPVSPGRTAAAAVEAFASHLAMSPGLQELAVRKLKGRDLACWCAVGQPCHADVLLRFVNRGAFL